MKRILALTLLLAVLLTLFTGCGGPSADEVALEGAKAATENRTADMKQYTHPEVWRATDGFAEADDEYRHITEINVEVAGEFDEVHLKAFQALMDDSFGIEVDDVKLYGCEATYTIGGSSRKDDTKYTFCVYRSGGRWYYGGYEWSTFLLRGAKYLPDDLLVYD